MEKSSPWNRVSARIRQRSLTAIRDMAVSSGVRQTRKRVDRG
jgi:hypothetical protein